MNHATYDPAAAIAKWPDVPACYGWLSLSARGQWRLQDEAVMHGGLRQFLNAFYTCDEQGAWFVQNGPQKVFVRLERAPLVLHFDDTGGLRTHTDHDSGAVVSVWLDEHGNVLLQTAAGPGALDDRDLTAFIEACTLRDGSHSSESDLLDAMNGQPCLCWRGLAVGFVRLEDAPAVLGFDPDPQPR